MTGKILGEIDRSCVGTATENKLKHLNRVASYACNGSRDTMLAFNSCVFEAVEQNQISWSNWDGIKSLHTKHLDSIRLKVNPNDKPTIADKNERTKDSTYVPDNYMKAQNICIKFQSSVCEHEASHEIDSGATVLNICGLCHMAEKKNMSDHGFKVFPLKKKRVFKTRGYGSPLYKICNQHPHHSSYPHHCTKSLLAFYCSIKGASATCC